jgi:outer membrane protein
MKIKLITALLVSNCFNAYALSLDESFISSYENNPGLQAQRDSLKAKDEAIYKAISRFLPTIDLQTNINKSSQNRDLITNNVYGPIKSPRDHLTSKTNQITIKQNLFEGGAALGLFGQAKESILADRQVLLQVESQTLLKTVSAYSNILFFQHALEISQTSITYWKTKYEAIKARYDAGLVRKTDLASAEQELAKSISKNIDTKSELYTAKADFINITGIEAENLVDLIPYQDIPKSFEEFLNLTLQNNFEIKKSRHETKAAEINVGLAMTAMLPQVNLEGSFAKNSRSLNTRDSATQRSKTIGINVRMPLYQKGVEYSDKRSATANAAASRNSLKSKIDQVKKDATEIWSKYTASLEAHKAAIQTLTSSKVALDGIQQEYNEGIVSITDLVQAQNNNIEAELNLSEKKRNMVIYSYQILYMFGKLTAKNLSLAVKYYDPEKNFNATKFKIIGF